MYVQHATPNLSSLSIRLFGGGKEEERKGKREEKADTKALRRVFRPLDEHDAWPQRVANQKNGHANVMSAITVALRKTLLEQLMRFTKESKLQTCFRKHRIWLLKLCKQNIFC